MAEAQGQEILSQAAREVTGKAFERHAKEFELRPVIDSQSI